MSCMTSGIHIDKSTFKLIFRDNWSDFVTKHDRYDSEYYHAVVQKMLDCGDPDKMGYAQYRCLNCGATKQVAFSCKSSFCLSCGKVYAEHWVDFISRRMFPGMVYRHIVLTVPDSSFFETGSIKIRNYFLCSCKLEKNVCRMY